METMELRRNAIVDFINKKGSITFAELKNEFSHVSEMTLRTDLRQLDETKRIVRVHGGAKSVEVVLGTDDLLGKRAIRNVEEKVTIAEKVAAMIRPHTTIFLDSGSTTTALAKIWPDQPNFIFTSSLTCAMELAKLSQPKVFIPGGELNTYSMSICGLETIKSLENVNFDLTILGITNYDPDCGFTCGVLMESYLKQAVLKQANDKMILMDSSKIGKKSTFNICSLGDVDMVVMDENVPESFRKECEEAGVQII